MPLTDADNAYCSIMRDPAIEEVVKIRPELVGFWAACYGGTEAPWMTLDDWSRIEITPLFQGFGLSPDFFALGVRGLQRSLRRELYSLPLALGVAPTLSAHLDDINGIAPLETMPNFLDKIRELGPEVGLHLVLFPQKLLLRALAF